jgi:hypothetical protein
MDNKDHQLVKYAAVGGVLALAYFILHYLSNRKETKAKHLSLEKTKKLMQEIKYQMYANCVSFAEGVNLKPKNIQGKKDV